MQEDIFHPASQMPSCTLSRLPVQLAIQGICPVSGSIKLVGYCSRGTICYILIEGGEGGGPPARALVKGMRYRAW